MISFKNEVMSFFVKLFFAKLIPQHTNSKFPITYPLLESILSRLAFFKDLILLYSRVFLGSRIFIPVYGQIPF